MLVGLAILFRLSALVRLLYSDERTYWYLRRVSWMSPDENSYSFLL
jgi:hypothetical protein